MITKDMQLIELMQKFPEAENIFAKHGMGCVRCMGAVTETIENGAKMHGVNLQELLKDLNSVLLTKKEEG